MGARLAARRSSQPIRRMANTHDRPFAAPFRHAGARKLTRYFRHCDSEPRYGAYACHGASPRVRECLGVGSRAADFFFFFFSPIAQRSVHARHLCEAPPVPNPRRELHYAVVRVICFEEPEAPCGKERPCGMPSVDMQQRPGRVVSQVCTYAV